MTHTPPPRAGTGFPDPLTGRVALVTGAGAGDGIGFVTARLLAARGLAVAVAATTARAHERAAELSAAGFSALGVVGDLSDPDQVSRVVCEVGDALGAPTVLVNNAGMTSVTADGGREAGRVGDLTPEAWRLSLARNLDTAFLVTRACLPAMVGAGWGRVVTVASVTGPVMAMRGEAGYAAAKAGLLGLTRSLAVDYASAGVTANAVAPGWVATGSQTPPEAGQALATPLGRSVTAHEVAATVAFLCSPDAAGLTGQCLVVDGGNSIAEERGHL